MTTDDFTTAAHAEASRRFPSGAPASSRFNAEQKAGRAGFIGGAVWSRTHLAAQEPTNAEVEAVARYFYKTQTSSDLIDTSLYRQNWLRIARNALAAAREARHDVP